MYASRKLARLVDLDQFLLEDRQRLAEKVSKIWEEAREKLATSYAAAYDSARIAIKGYPLLAETYLEELEKAQDVEQLSKFFKRSARDLQSVHISSPFKKSQRGHKGPTFLVSYLREGSLGAKRKECVIKWTHWNELTCNRIYRIFTQCLKKEIKSSGTFYKMLIPQAGGLDFERAIHQHVSGQITTLAPEQAKELEEIFLKITQYYGKTPNDKQVMLARKIPGANLFDFARRKYSELDGQQKIRFFHSLSLLAMIDLITGNLDRLIQVYYNAQAKKYQLEDFEANLGNVMVEWDMKSNPILYAIDNGMDGDLSENKPLCQRAYSSFLRETFTHPNCVDMLAENMLNSFKSALSTQPDDTDDPGITREELKTFSQDINTSALDNLKTGIIKALHILKEGSKVMEIKQELVNLKQSTPGFCLSLLHACQERLETFYTSISPAM